MNGKRAKKLRRMAEVTTVGNKHIDYNNINWRKKEIDRGYSEPVFYFSTCTVELVNNCTRKAYKVAKNAYKSGVSDISFVLKMHQASNA